MPPRLLLELRDGASWPLYGEGKEEEKKERERRGRGGCMSIFSSTETARWCSSARFSEQKSVDRKRGRGKNFLLAHVEWKPTALVNQKLKKRKKEKTRKERSRRNPLHRVVFECRERIKLFSGTAKGFPVKKDSIRSVSKEEEKREKKKGKRGRGGGV